MDAQQFRPQFSTSASKQEENKEAREAAGSYFGQRVSVTPGRNKPTNVKPAECKIPAVRDAIAFSEAEAATKHEIRTNGVRLKRAEERRKRGHAS